MTQYAQHALAAAAALVITITLMAQATIIPAENAAIVAILA